MVYGTVGECQVWSQSPQQESQLTKSGRKMGWGKGLE